MSFAKQILCCLGSKNSVGCTKEPLTAKPKGPDPQSLRVHYEADKSAECSSVTNLRH